MGTTIRLSDGGVVRLGGEPEGIIRGIASALDAAHATADEQGKPVPKGFVRYTLPQGDQTWVNNAQITSIVKT